MNKEDIDFLISIQDLEQPDFDNDCLERENKRLNKEIDRLNNIINELTDLILLKKARAENEKDYSKYYIEGFTNALKTTHSTPDGIMLETVKSTTIAICKEILEKLKELKESNNETKKEC